MSGSVMRLLRGYVLGLALLVVALDAGAIGAGTVSPYPDSTPNVVGAKESRPRKVSPRFYKQRWPQGTTITVENRLGPNAADVIEQVVAEWDAITPKLQFRVVHSTTRDCGWRRQRIVLCYRSLDDVTAQTSTRLLSSYRTATTLTAALIEFDPKWASPPWDTLVCHEFGHALGLKHGRPSETSCMSDWSYLSGPGSYDRVSLRILYRQGWR